MTPAAIVKLLRDQFGKSGHSFQVGDTGGTDFTEICERLPDGSLDFWGRVNSSSDADVLVMAINAACGVDDTKRYVVELEPGVYIADEIGDPGRTLFLRCASRFLDKRVAMAALATARTYRPFGNARIVPVVPSMKPGVHWEPLC